MNHRNSDSNLKVYMAYLFTVKSRLMHPDLWRRLYLLLLGHYCSDPRFLSPSAGGGVEEAKTATGVHMCMCRAAGWSLARSHPAQAYTRTLTHALFCFLGDAGPHICLEAWLLSGTAGTVINMAAGHSTGPVLRQGTHCPR